MPQLCSTWMAGRSCVDVGAVYWRPENNLPKIKPQRRRYSMLQCCNKVQYFKENIQINVNTNATSVGNETDNNNWGSIWFLSIGRNCHLATFPISSKRISLPPPPSHLHKSAGVVPPPLQAFYQPSHGIPFP